MASLFLFFLLLPLSQYRVDIGLLLNIEPALKLDLAGVHTCNNSQFLMLLPFVFQSDFSTLTSYARFFAGVQRNHVKSCVAALSHRPLTRTLSLIDSIPHTPRHLKISNHI